MKAVIAAVVLVLATLCSPAAQAWNCSDPLAERVLVPSGTSGTYGDGDGQLANFNGQLYVCEVVKPASPTTGGNSNASSTSSSQSNSASNASSQSTATGGKSSSSSISTGGNATGGNASAGVSNAGNSTNVNNNTASGGAGGSASATGGNQHQSQSNSLANSGNSVATASGNGVGNGNNSNNYSNTTNVPAAAASAYAPPVYPTATCFKGFSGGASAIAGGISFGGGRIDSNCADLEAANHAPSRLARCKIFIVNKYAKEAGVTLADCMGPEPASPVVSQVVAEQRVASPAPQIVVNVPAPVVTIIPAPLVAPLPSVAEAAKVNKPTWHKPVKPCITNDDIDAAFTRGYNAGEKNGGTK